MDSQSPSRQFKERRLALAALAACCILVRLPLWLGSQGSAFDMESYARVAGALANGHGLYGNADLQGRYPYLPLWGLLTWALSALASLSQLPPKILFKLPAVAADLGLTLLIFRMLERLAGPDRSTASLWMGRPYWSALAYALSPLSLLISAGHGQFDSVALFFVVAAVWYIEFSDAPRADLAAALALGFAISFKSWPFFFLPLFIKGLSGRQERYRFIGISLALPLGLLLPFAFDAGASATWHSLSYSGATALSLPESLRSFFYGSGASAESYKAIAGLWKALALSILGLSWLSYSLGPWRFALLPGLGAAVLTLYVFAPGLSAQYLLWLLPFALLNPGRLALRYTAVASLALMSFYLCFAPEVLFPASAYSPPALPAGAFMVWGILNLAFWLALVSEWIKLLALARRPGGRLAFS